MKNDVILKIYSRPETVFTVNELAQILPSVSEESLRDRLYYFAKTGKILRLRRGLYAKPDFNRFEMANKLYRPSYISLETVLALGGMTFQYYETIFLVSYLTREIAVEKTNIQYRRIEREILTNNEGVEYKDGYFVASLERAFLDAVYIYKNYHFDNLGGIDWEKVESLKKIYKSKIFNKRVDGYYGDAK